MDSKPGDINSDNKLSIVSLKQNLKEKCDEIDRLKQIIEEQKVSFKFTRFYRYFISNKKHPAQIKTAHFMHLLCNILFHEIIFNM